ncbi:MAG: response regulator [Opitutus sp.]
MGSSQTILIIDDELGARSALQVILEGQHAVKLFSRGSEAIDFVRGNPDVAHAAFVDFTMPEMDGATVCRLLTSVDPTLSLIGITGNVAADFEVPLFASIEKRGTAVGKVRETAALAVAATGTNRQLRDQERI